MELLDSYLKTLKPYLPRGQRDDIVKELSDNILSQVEDREAALGRPLTASEQEEILKRHGQPLVVAGRYQSNPRSLTFGIELIGPALFPIYRTVLWINLCVAVLLFPTISFLAGHPATLLRILLQIVLQLGCVTLIFISIEISQRKSSQTWRILPAHLQPIRRWQSVAGLVAWIISCVWWAALPFLVGRSASNLRFTPALRAFYVLSLLLLLAGVVQRAFSLARPQWTWQAPAARLAINVVGIAVCALMIGHAPFVVIADPTLNPALYEKLAAGLNTLIQWGLLGWMWGYLPVNMIIHACVLAADVRRRRRAQAPSSIF